MLEHSGDSLDLFDAYGVDYVYISGHERYNFELDEAWFAENAELVYAGGECSVYAPAGVHWKSAQS